MTKKQKRGTTVKTISGKIIDKNNAFLIDKEYYEKNIDCVQISEKWYPINSNKIGLNITTEKWEFTEDLLKQGLSPFIISFYNKDYKKPIFGWDQVNKLINVPVKSHFNELSKNLKSYERDLEKQKKFVETKKTQLEKLNLFENYYNKFITFLSKLKYYRQIMEKTYDLDNIEAKQIYKIIIEVDSFINSDEKVLETFKEFTYCYKLHVDKYSSESVPESPLKKITFESLEEFPALEKLFDVFINYTGVVPGIQNEIKNAERIIEEYEKQIEIIIKQGYFNGFCRNKEEALKLGFIDNKINDFLYLEANLSSSEKSQLEQTFLNFSESVYKNLKINYNASSLSDTFEKILYNYFSLSKYRSLTRDSYNIAKLLKGLSIGIEFETIGGRIREQDLSLLGVVPLRDGSIKGFEFTTIPYGMKNSFLNQTDTVELAKDLISLKKLCKELSEKTIIDNTCSMHLHIGNARKDKLFLIALYMLSYKIQEELFLFQPKFKEDSPKYLGTQKNYCQKLDHLNLFDNCIFDKSSVLKTNYCDNVDLHFNKIFKFLSGGYDIGSKFNRKNYNHPYSRKWERTARYHWINLVNTVFSRSGTIEFRLHSSTLNFTKVLNWILICAAIVKYTESHIKEIVSGSIKDIDLNTILLGYSNNFRDKKGVNTYGLFIYNYLSSYIKDRKMYFKEECDKKLYLGQDDLKKDKMYKFVFNGIDSLI